MFADKLLKLVSLFPTKKGEFKRTSKDRILFADTGEIKYRDKAKELINFIKDMEKGKEKGQLNRYHYKSAELFYWVFVDLFGFKQRKSAGNDEYDRIDMAMTEFCDILTLVTMKNDEGMMRDYIEKVEKRMLTEKDEDVRGLYRVITGETWTSWCNSWWHWTSGFKEADSNYSIENFLDNMEEAITELIEKEKVIEQSAQKQINQRRIQTAEQRAEQIKIIGGVFTKTMFKLNDEELRDIVIDSQGKIVEAITKHVMKHDSAPEQILDAVMEEITSNKDQVIEDKEKYEGKVSAELIKAGIRNFLSQGTLLNDVNVSCGVSTGVSK